MDLGFGIKDRALRAGFDLAGVAPIAAWEDLKFSRQWVERGFGGEMKYLENPKRDDPRGILPSARSVVCLGLVYNAPLPYSAEVRNQKSEIRSDKEAARRQQLEDRRPRKSRPFSVAAFQLQKPEDCGTAVSTGYSATDNEPRTADSFQSAAANPKSEIKNPKSNARAWISRYAWGRDYHEVMRSKLERLRAEIEALAPNVETRVFVDTGPIVERAFARLSGIGWTGKNTCLINESKGSWFFLGVILTSLALAPDLPAPDRCGSCTRCLEACPTGALVEPYVMDASRCIAYFNIELKGSIPGAFRPAIGANVFGCDICQDVCPWNGGSQNSEFRSQKSKVRRQKIEEGNLKKELERKRSAATTLPEFRPQAILLPYAATIPGQLTTDDGPRAKDNGPRTKDTLFSLFNPPLEALASMSEDDFRQAFRHSPIKRVKYRGWLRNLCVVMGNSGDPRFIPKLNELALHPDLIVREHAAWARNKLGSIEIRKHPISSNAASANSHS